MSKMDPPFEAARKLGKGRLILEDVEAPALGGVAQMLEFVSDLDLVAFPVEDGWEFTFQSVAILLRPLSLGSRSTRVDGHGYPELRSGKRQLGVSTISSFAWD